MFLGHFPCAFVIFLKPLRPELSHGQSSFFERRFAVTLYLR
jgi:hypothetical protein